MTLCKRPYHLLILGFFIVLVDRLTKLYAMHWLREPFSVLPGFTLVFTQNRGISWGMFDGADFYTHLGIVTLIIIIIGSLALYTYQQYRRNYTIVGELMVLAGACANIIDRVWYGGVIDFILLSCPAYAFPVFNIADCAIVCGAMIMFVNAFHTP